MVLNFAGNAKPRFGLRRIKAEASPKREDDGMEDQTIMHLPHNFKRIVLHLARSKEHPEGSARHGYELVVPLTEDGRIDAHAWQSHRDNCRVRRFWNGEPDAMGKVVHRAGGDRGARWVFDYDSSTEFDDEAGYRLSDHVFAPGEYISIRDEDEEMHTFRVVSVVDAT